MSAQESWERVGNLSDTDQPLSDQTVKDLLAPLQRLMGDYELFALAVGIYDEDNELRAFVHHAAYSSGHHAVFLSTNLPNRSSPLSILDPFPGMALIAERPEKFGMSEYVQRFAENGIGFAALRHLTDQDLKDIGVLLGHRRIMLAAIQELGNPAAAQPAGAGQGGCHTRLSQRRPVRARHRRGLAEGGVRGARRSLRAARQARR